MNVLITGGTGFIGSRLALDWLRRGHSVAVLGQENTWAESQNKQLIEAKGGKAIILSVTEREKVFTFLEKVDLLYHLAAAQHEANVPDKAFRDVNIEGTRNVLEASVKAGVKRFIYGSTIGVYGSALGGLLNEDSPLRPDNIYGVTKLEAERLVLSFQEKLPVTVVRICETYGPGDHRLLKLFKGIKKNIFFIIGSGRNIHHPIYIGDLLEGLCLAATVDQAIGKVFVLSGYEALTTSAIVETISKYLGKQAPSIRLPLLPFVTAATIMESICKPIGVQPPLHRRRLDFFRKDFRFSQERAREILGFVPRIGFKPGVTQTGAWYRKMGYL